MKYLLLVILSLGVTGAAYSQNTWRSIPSGTNKHLLSVSFGNNLVGYISGKDGLLLKTTDGGNTWNPLSFTGMSFPMQAKDIVQVNFLNPYVGYAVVNDAQSHMYSGATYKTYDGGSAWTLVRSGNISTYRSFFFKEDEGYQIGSGFFSGNVLEKLSGGTWTNYHYFNFNPSSCLFGIDFYDTLTGITGGSGGYVYRTFNAGLSWDTVKTNTDSTINAIRYISRSMIVAATNRSSGTLIVSHDSGRSWQSDVFSSTFFYPKMKSMLRSRSDSLISVGVSEDSSKGVIYWYRNGIPRVESVPQPLAEVGSRNDSVAFAVGDSGLIVTNSLSPLKATIISVTVPALILYPDPSSGIFSTEMSEPHSLSIYDLSGRLVFRQPIPLTHHQINLSTRPGGIYLLEARLGDGRRIFRKLSLQ